MGQSTRPTYDIMLNQGETFALTLTIEEPEGTPLDITSYTFEADIKQNKTDTSAIDAFTFNIDDAPNGIVTMSLTDTETGALPAIVGFWDLLMTSDSAVKTRILEGRITITQQVTT